MPHSRSISVFAAICTIMVSSAELSKSSTNMLLVQTQNGPVKGKDTGNGVHAWYAIPFAQPPLDMLRFKAPSPMNESWTETRDCSVKRRVQCVSGSANDGTEDCLYLNVWAPAHLSEKSSVMLWIYGGSFKTGNFLKGMLFDGSQLAKSTDQIVVTVNYRIVIFGFLAHPALQEEDENGSTGNFGLQDQRLAMKWVQENIAAFGGDPKRVTIFGESAGGMSVCYHVASLASAGLFSRAIMESGSCDLPEIFQPLEKALAIGKAVVNHKGCGAGGNEHIRRCIRNLSSRELTDNFWDNYYPGLLGSLEEATKSVQKRPVPVLSPLLTYVPTVDGSFTGMTGTPLEMVRAGNFSKVPVIFGSNRDEGTLFDVFIPFYYPFHPLVRKLPETTLGTNSFIRLLFPNKTSAQRVIDEYASNKFQTEDSRAAAVSRDHVFVCSVERMLAALIEQGNNDTWQYRFMYNNFTGIAKLLQPISGDFHSSEIGFVFQHKGQFPVSDNDPTDAKMMDTFRQYWGAFSTNANPNNSTGLPGTLDAVYWPRYTLKDKIHMKLAVPSEPKVGLKTRQCDMLDDIMKYHKGTEVFHANTANNYWH